MRSIPLKTAALLLTLGPWALHAHGDVTPQAVKVEGLPNIEGLVDENPYRADPEVHAMAVKVGASAYNQNCARCHGLDAVSGGIAPDLRYLPPKTLGDEYYAQKVRNGVIRNGVTYMPGFADVFPEEAVWALRSYLDEVYTEE